MKVAGLLVKKTFRKDEFIMVENQLKPMPFTNFRLDPPPPPPGFPPGTIFPPSPPTLPPGWSHWHVGIGR